MQWTAVALVLLATLTGCSDARSPDAGGSSVASSAVRPNDHGPPAASSSSPAPTASSFWDSQLPQEIATAVSGGVAQGGLCSGAKRPLPDRAHVVTQVGATVLVALPCEFFAYNVSFQLAIFDGNLHPVTVPTFDTATASVVDRSLVFSVGFESATSGEFSVLSKGRGVGGCGDAATYRLEGQRVVLIEARSFECQSQVIDNPDDWPTVYRSS
jgi:Protein of unknown function (DUF1176)